MTINVRVRDGMCPDPTTGDGGATEGDIRGSFSDIIDVVGVKDLAGGHCAVTENSPAALSVLVAPGIVYIPNADYDELDSNQVKFWEAIVTVSTAVTITANTSGSARVDLVCAKMDTAVTPDEHASNIVTLVAVAGTPGAGAPATPDNHYVLATVAVANGASTIVNANITSTRVQSKIDFDFLPKATGAEVDTGTEDAKIVTPKALADSDYAKTSDIPTVPDIGGWITMGACTYEGADAPTYTISFASDMTGVLSPGMRIKVTDVTVKYFIVTAVGAFSAGKTIITVYGGTDYALTGGAITLPYYSTQKAPQGFPLDITKWSVKTTSTDSYATATPTANTWYTYANLVISVPIGAWKLGYQANLGVDDTSVTSVIVQATLSTANNSESDTEFTCYTRSEGASGNITLNTFVSKEKYVSISSKTSYYLLNRTTATGIANITFPGGAGNSLITAVSAYL